MTTRNLTSASEVMIIAVTSEGEFHCGYLRNFDITENFQLSEEKAIGAYRTVEVVVHGAGVSFVADEACLFNKTLRERGIVLRDARFPFGDYIIWRLFDKKTNTDLGIVVDAHVQTTSTTINAQQTITSRLNGVAVQFYDRSELG